MDESSQTNICLLYKWIFFNITLTIHSFHVNFSYSTILWSRYNVVTLLVANLYIRTLYVCILEREIQYLLVLLVLYARPCPINPYDAVNGK
jgi:hypothetical protein